MKKFSFEYEIDEKELDAIAEAIGWSEQLEISKMDLICGQAKGLLSNLFGAHKIREAKKREQIKAQKAAKETIDKVSEGFQISFKDKE